MHVLPGRKSSGCPVAVCTAVGTIWRASKLGGLNIKEYLQPRKSAREKSYSRNEAVPRVINVDKNPAYPRAVEDLKREGTISRRCRLRQCKYLNNVVEQDHRNVKRRTWLAKGYGSLWTAWRTLRGIEAMDMVRKGRVRWIAKGDPVGQAKFIGKLFAA